MSTGADLVEARRIARARERIDRVSTMHTDTCRRLSKAVDRRDCRTAARLCVEMARLARQSGWPDCAAGWLTSAAGWRRVAFPPAYQPCPHCCGEGVDEHGWGGICQACGGIGSARVCR